MNILSFDTSTKAASIALLKGDELIGEVFINDKRTHSQKLMPMLESLFKLGDITMDDIDLLAVCIGPGSFTGLRIAMATVKAIAHVKNLKIVAVNSLESLAFNLGHTAKKIISILDAQGKNLYTASYKMEKNILKQVSEIEVLEIDELVARIKEEGQEVLILGEGLDKSKEAFKFDLVEFASPDKNVSKASSVAVLASEKYRKNIDVYTCYDIEPLYIRKSQAEIQYEEKQRKLKKQIAVSRG